MKRVFLVIVIIFSMFLVGCSYEGLMGKPGEQGIPGETGPKGDKGEQGIPGKDGEDGITPVIGENGNWWIGSTDTGINAKGEKGDKGDKGDRGEQGTPGINGKDGTSLLTGNEEPTNDLGKNGDSYINLSTWDFYIKSEDVWALTGNIKVENTEEENIGTLGLVYYPLNDTECAVAGGTTRFLQEIVIPSTYCKLTVTKILGSGFGSHDLMKITIPDSVTTIGGTAFIQCYNLRSITIPNSVTSIGSGAFSGCRSLTDIYFTGTKEQWTSITEYYRWNETAPVIIIHCTDGDISIFN